MSDQTTVDHFADAIAAAMPPLSARQLELVLSAYRAIVAGRPAEVSSIADGAGWGADEAAAQLGDWPGVYCDDQGMASSTGGSSELGSPG